MASREASDKTLTKELPSGDVALITDLKQTVDNSNPRNLVREFDFFVEFGFPIRYKNPESHDLHWEKLNKPVHISDEKGWVALKQIDPQKGVIVLVRVSQKKGSSLTLLKDNEPIRTTKISMETLKRAGIDFNAADLTDSKGEILPERMGNIFYNFALGDETPKGVGSGGLQKRA